LLNFFLQSLPLALRRAKRSTKPSTALSSPFTVFPLGKESEKAEKKQIEQIIDFCKNGYHFETFLTPGSSQAPIFGSGYSRYLIHPTGLSPL
jgi:hypothetical protein